MDLADLLVDRQQRRRAISLGVAIHVLEIHADGARFDNGAGCRNRVVITGFDVGGHRDRDGTRDTVHYFQHFVARDMLAVGITQRKCHAGAAGSDGRASGVLEDAGAGNVPGVGQHQNSRAMMQCPEGFDFFFPWHPQKRWADLPCGGLPSETDAKIPVKF